MSHTFDPGLILVAPASQLPLRIRLERPIGDDELFDLCGRNPDLRIERTSEGELIAIPPTGGETGNRNAILNFRLQAWNHAARRGRVFDSSTGFILPNGAERAPDASWIRNERWEALLPEARRGFPPLCPDLVVELRSTGRAGGPALDDPPQSATDRLSALHEKLREYLDNGAQVGLLIDPDERVAWLYRPGGAVERLDAPERIMLGPALPGFELEMDGIW